MLSSSNIGTCRGNQGFTACVVKNNLHSGIHTDRNALDLNYVVEATSENKCICFQDYDYIVRKSAQKMYQSSPFSPTSKMN